MYSSYATIEDSDFQEMFARGAGRMDLLGREGQERLDKFLI